MAEQSARDVVDQTLSVGDISPSDAPATNFDDQAIAGDGADSTQLDDDKPTSQEAVSSQDKGRTEAAINHEAEVDTSTGDPSVVSPAHLMSKVISLTSEEATDNNNTGQDPSRGEQPGPTVNGLTLSDDPEELKQGIGDASGGSDTDTSRVDVKVSEDGKHHMRTNSVKKPTTFKPVSFTKFSVAKPSGSATPVKASGDKGSFSVSKRWAVINSPFRSQCRDFLDTNSTTRLQTSLSR